MAAITFDFSCVKSDPSPINCDFCSLTFHFLHSLFVGKSLTVFTKGSKVPLHVSFLWKSDESLADQASAP